MMPVWTDNGIRSLQEFCQQIIFRPIPLDEQVTIRDGEKIWCQDWEIIELCKCLWHGEEVYRGDPPPNRLKNNPLWSKDVIVEKARKKHIMCDLLRSDANKDIQNLIVMDCGRGLDVLLAAMTRSFNSIVACDTNIAMLDEVEFYFKHRYPLPVVTRNTDTRPVESNVFEIRNSIAIPWR